MPQYFSFNPTQLNPSHVLKNATQPNPTHGWTQPMSISGVTPRGGRPAAAAGHDGCGGDGAATRRHGGPAGARDLPRTGRRPRQDGGEGVERRAESAETRTHRQRTVRLAL